MPFLSANADSISLVGKSRRAALVQILSHVGILNGTIEDMLYWDRLTFNPGNNGNYVRAVQNSDSSKEAIVSACKRIGQMIDNALA